MLSALQHTWRQSAWPVRFFLTIVGFNILLMVIGLLIVPSTLATLSGIVDSLAAIAMQCALAALALIGPWSFRRCRPSMEIIMVVGALFALSYESIVLAEFLGVQDNINVLILFVVASLVAGLAAGYHTRQWWQGFFAAIWTLVIGTVIWSAGLIVINYLLWGSHQQYVFWLYDGAIDDFRRSGSTNLYAFLLQDMQGALFFHPLLSIVLGTIIGLIASTCGQIIVWLQNVLRRQRA